MFITMRHPKLFQVRQRLGVILVAIQIVLVVFASYDVNSFRIDMINQVHLTLGCMIGSSTDD